MPSKSSSRGSGPNNPTKTAAPKANGAPKTATANSQAKSTDSHPAPSSGTVAAKDISVASVSPAGQPMSGIDAAPGTKEAPTVNRKKQKRRQKQAARLAAAEQTFPAAAGGQSQAYVDARDASYHDSAYARATTQMQRSTNGYDYGVSDYEDPDQYEPGEGEDLYYTDEDDRLLEKPYTGMRSNGYSTNDQLPGEDSRNKAKRKKKNKSSAMPQPGYPSNYNPSDPPHKTPAVTHQQGPPPPPPGLSSAALRSAHHISKDRIWNTSTAEERERIKEFWLSLGEDERRSLVKVEKEAVLKKMKEQQKHSCSCTVCGRKRTAIEEELEVLYDAYYEELEQYANHQQINLADGAPIIPPPRMYSQHIGRMPSGQRVQGTNTVRSSRGRIQEVTDDDEADEEDYSDEEDEEISEEDAEDQIGSAADFFNFGNSLTVQGGILTVADDLLKNDGKKFIEMMEQLAERRMQREEEAQYQASRYPSMQPHNHGPALNDDDEDYDDEGDDEEYSDDDDSFEEDEMEAMTEEQRMEEGRRMFQIFAARMFEQRVLTAYREKVARERQQKLLEELDEESRLDTQREAKKAKDAQKKKDKKRQQKQAKDEEKAKREAEKAAEEAASRAIEEKKLEEQRQKKEEQRKKKEAEKKAQEEERQRKEAEKQKRLREAREHQAEQERKQREQKEREKKKREEAKKKEKEEREAKEQQLRAKKERDTTEQGDREVKAKMEKEDTARKRKDEQTAKLPTPAAPAVPNFPQSKPNLPSSAAPPSAGLQPPQTTSSHASPHLPIATPVIPKAPTPIRSRQASFQGSHTSSPKATLPPTEGLTTSPSAPPQARNVATAQLGKSANAPSSSQLHQRTPPFTPVSGAPPPPTQPPGLSNVPAAAGNSFHSNFGSTIPKAAQRGPIPEAAMFSHQAPYNGYRPFMGPNPSAYPPGLGGPTPMRPFPQGRGGPVESPSALMSTGPPMGPMPAAHHPAQYNIPRDNIPPHSSHSRQSSASLENSIPPQAQPIARPAPIQRPSSTAPQQQGESYRKSAHADLDDLSNHLGSSALLDDTDVPLSSNTTNSRRGSMAPGAPRSAGPGFAGAPAFQDPIGTAKSDNFGRVQIGTGIGIAWNSPELPSTGHQMSGSANWPNASRPGWPNNNGFGGILGGSARPSGSRAVTIRLLVVQACSKLSAHPPTDSRWGFHNVDTVLNQVEHMKPPHEGPISMKEMLDICDTEGNTQNGGGSFIIEHHEPHTFVKFEPGRTTSISMSGGIGPGDIGSPIPGGAIPSFGGGRGFPQHGHVMSSSGF